MLDSSRELIIDDYTTAMLSQDSVVEDSVVEDSKAVKPPFGYYGSKQRIAKKIIHNLPPHSAWVEAFCGSAAVTLAKKPASIEIINDIDGQIVNVFEQLRKNPEELIRAVELTPYARTEFKESRTATAADCPIERARQFIVSTMMTVNGTNGTDKTGFSVSPSYSRANVEARVNRWNNLPDRLQEVVRRLKNVRIENLDGRELVKMFSNRPATLMYLDPPYLTDRNHGYLRDAKEEEFHIDLLNLCCRSKCMIMISAYENPLYDSILTKKGWKRSTIITHTRTTDGVRHVKTEVLWKNKYFVAAHLTGNLPLKLTAKEIKEKKVNPSRGRVLK